jgi:1,4-dihydroxy-2-naphthoate octaprenyltransferase
MNYKLLIGIPVTIVAVFILLESPEYWWLLLAIPLLFIKKQMRSIQNSAGNSMYDEEYQRIFDNPPADDNPVTTTLETDDSNKH